MNEITKIKKVLGRLTNNELEYLKNYISAHRDNPHDVSDNTETNIWISHGIENIGIFKMKNLIDEIIKERQDIKKIKKINNTDIKANAYEEIVNMLKYLNARELFYLEDRLRDLHRNGIEMKYLQKYTFFESDYRDRFEVAEIEDCIKAGITILGLSQTLDLVCDISRHKEKEWEAHEEKFNELQRKIIAWGRLKNINDPKSQFLKVIEELGEIQLAKNKQEFMDAIGDTLVTLIILNNILQRKQKDKDYICHLLIEEIYESEFYEYVEEKGNLKDFEEFINCTSTDIIIQLSVLAEYISKMTGDNEEFYAYRSYDHIFKIVRYVIYIAESTNTDYIECLQLAYDTIANRKGKTIDGVFVKEEDL